MKFTDDYGDLEIGDLIYIKGKRGKSWVKYKTRVKRFVNKKYIVPDYLEIIGSYLSTTWLYVPMEKDLKIDFKRKQGWYTNADDRWTRSPSQEISAGFGQQTR